MMLTEMGFVRKGTKAMAQSQVAEQSEGRRILRCALLKPKYIIGGLGLRRDCHLLEPPNPGFVAHILFG
jgi:hypothetical protein